ncbi:hypothetical protein IV102_13345 [bacterium]|nr:hypothetical protein [bacterium]
MKTIHSLKQFSLPKTLQSTGTPPAMGLQSTPAATPIPPIDGWDSGMGLAEVASNSMGVLAGTLNSISRIVVGGCAGGAEGLVRGANVSADQASLAFKAGMAANLALTGALAGGVGALNFLSLSPAEGALAGAASNVVIGNNEWGRQSGAFQEQVKFTTGQWLEASLEKLPPSLVDDPGMLGNVSRAVVGELVGIAAGAYTGVTVIRDSYRQGFDWGSGSMDKVAQWFEPPAQEQE